MKAIKGRRESRRKDKLASFLRPPSRVSMPSARSYYRYYYRCWPDSSAARYFANMQFSLRRVQLKRLFNSSLPTFPEKLRGGSIEKAVDYLKLVYSDYRTVFFDVLKESREKPLKACLYGGSILTSYYLWRTNPDFNDFEQQLINAHNDLVITPESIRNENSYQYISYLQNLQKQKILRRFNCVLISVIYHADFSPECALYEKTCDYLKPSYIQWFRERIIDVGFAGSYKIIAKKMIDYDINENEWIKEMEQ